MQHFLKQIRRVLAFIVGVPIVILGLILIPLPGPGILISFVGLFILALEFEWAAKHRDKTKDQLKQVMKTARERAKVQDK